MIPNSKIGYNTLPQETFWSVALQILTAQINNKTKSQRKPKLRLQLSISTLFLSLKELLRRKMNISQLIHVVCSLNKANKKLKQWSNNIGVPHTFYMLLLSYIYLLLTNILVFVCLFVLFFFFLATPCSIWDRSNKADTQFSWTKILRRGRP